MPPRQVKRWGAEDIEQAEVKKYSFLSILEDVISLINALLPPGNKCTHSDI